MQPENGFRQPPPPPESGSATTSAVQGCRTRRPLPIDWNRTATIQCHISGCRTQSRPIQLNELFDFLICGDYHYNCWCFIFFFGFFCPPPPLFVQLSRIDFIFTWNKYDYRRNYFSGKIRAGASRRWDSFHIFLISSGGLKYSTLSLISKQKTHTNQLIKIMEEVCWYWPGVVGKWQWGQPMKSMVTSQIRTDNWIEPTAVWNEPHSQSMNKNPERNMLRGCDNNTHTHTC